MEPVLNARNALMKAPIPDPATPPEHLARGEFCGRVERARAVADLRFSLARYRCGDHAAPHEHESPLLCLVLEGGCEDRYRTRDHRPGRGDLFFCPPGEAHAQHYPVASRFLIVELGTEADARADVRGLGPCLIADAAARSSAWRLYSELARPDDLSPLALEGITLDLTARFLRLERWPRTRARPSWLERVHEILRSRLEHAPTLAELGAEVGRHPVALARAFRRHEGTSIGERLRALRVEEAARLLVSTRLSLADIALRVGFSDQSHMSRVFRRVTGRTPGSLRR